MPSHIFTRLGYWDEATTTNENAWQISDDDVKAAKEPEHAARLSLAELSVLQLPSDGPLSRCEEGGRVSSRAQYAAITNRQTAPDSQDLQARHVRGRTIFALPDRVLYGYFDTLARFIVESESWDDVPSLPLVATSSDFVVMKLHLEVMAAAHRKDAATAKLKAAEMMARASVPGQHPFVQQILTMQAREAAAAAAYAAGDAAAAVKEMEAAIAIEDAIDSLSQPPYPIVPRPRAVWLDADGHGQARRGAQAVRGDVEAHARPAQGHRRHRAGRRGHGRYGHGQGTVHTPDRHVEERRSRSSGAAGRAAIPAIGEPMTAVVNSFLLL